MTHLEVAEAFDLLSHEVRIGIVCALYEAEGTDGTPGLRFAELRRRVEMEVSSRFSYHLTRMRGLLVRKSDDSYQLTPAGETMGQFITETFADCPMGSTRADTPSARKQDGEWTR